MLLGGVSVDDRFIQGLASRVDRPLGAKLESALLFRAKIVGLTRDERTAVLRALENAPPDLQELRDLLVAHDSWRLNQRLG